MCLSTAYEVGNGSEKFICDRVTNVSVDGNNVKLLTLLGIETVVTGKLASVDLERNIIKIETK